MYCKHIFFTVQDQAKANVCVTKAMVKDALDQLRGAVMIVYPMQLPAHDPIRQEFENQEDLAGQHVSIYCIVLLYAVT